MYYNGHNLGFLDVFFLFFFLFKFFFPDVALGGPHLGDVSLKKVIKKRHIRIVR